MAAEFVGDEERMRALLQDDDPEVRLRAEFLLHVAEHPEPNVRVTTRGRWLAARRPGPPRAGRPR